MRPDPIEVMIRTAELLEEARPHVEDAALQHQLALGHSLLLDAAGETDQLHARLTVYCEAMHAIVERASTVFPSFVPPRTAVPVAGASIRELHAVKAQLDALATELLTVHIPLPLVSATDASHMTLLADILQVIEDDLEAASKHSGYQKPL